MFLFRSNLNNSNWVWILSLLTKVWSSFISSEKGKQKEFFIEPLLKPFLGSTTLPSNLSLLLASTTLNSFVLMFSSICFLFLTSSVFSCGSGVTASVLALAYSLIDNKYKPTIYDGSWSEYGKF